MQSGDQIRASVSVRRSVEDSFALFTREIDLWWRRGPKYRHSGRDPGVMHLETRPGGRVFEQIGPQLLEIGRITLWDPPHRLVFTWRNANFAPHEVTEVEVDFKPYGEGTMVSVTHRGWATIPADHPARHGLAVPAFRAMMGMWWGEQLTSLREKAA